MNKITSVDEQGKSKTTGKKNKQITRNGLRKWNIVLAGLHALQGVAVLALARNATLPVNTTFLSIDELASRAVDRPVLAEATRHLFDINLAYLVAAFFFMSAVAHGVVATWYRKGYESGLTHGINKARWIEYAFSASTMIVAIGLLSGVYSITALLMLFGFVAIMNLMGLAMEWRNKDRQDVDWSNFVIGCIAGIIPWVVIGTYLWHANLYGEGNVPAFVYWIYVSIFVFFNLFAINMYLQYKRKGKWADYLYGERAYMILSLVAKSALAWQVFAGALRP